MQTAEADAVVLQTKIDMLQKEIDLAVQEGKDHNELVQKQKALRKELDAKKQVIADTTGKIAEAQNQISSLKVKISAIAESIGDNALKTIAKEFATSNEMVDLPSFGMQLVNMMTLYFGPQNWMFARSVLNDSATL